MKYEKINQTHPTGHTSESSKVWIFYSDDLRTYVRMTWASPSEELVRVEVCPPYEIHTVTEGRKKIRVRYIEWNDDEETGKRIISGFQFPSRKFNRYESFLFNLNGELVSED